MSSLRFNHVFAFMILAGALSSFVLPGETGKSRIDILFKPISRPAYLLASSLHERLGARPDILRDADHNPLTTVELSAENQELIRENSNLQRQLEDLRKLNNDRSAVGDARRYCEPFSVIGGDTGGRQSITIEGASGSSASHLSRGMAVLRAQTLIGRIATSGMGTARVQLISDADFHVTVSFGRWEKKKSASIPGGEAAGSENEAANVFVSLAAPPTSIAGDGRGKLRISQLRFDQVREFHLAVGDYVRLDDTDGWPAIVQGAVLGRIESIGEQPHQPLFAQIVVNPGLDLKRLSEVMVVDRLGGR